jgi:hypothetical protein
MKVQTQTEEVRRLRRTNLELIFSTTTRTACRRARTSARATSTSRASSSRTPRATSASRRGSSSARSRSHRCLGRGLPGAVRGALPARRGRRGDRDPRLAPVRRRHGHQVDARRDLDPPSRSSNSPDRRRAAVIGSGPAGMAAAYYLLSPATRSPSSSATRRRAGCSATASPSTACQGRGPRGRVRERDRLGGKIVCNQGLGRDFTLDDLQYQGFDAVLIAIGCYDTNKLGIPARTRRGASTASSTCAPPRSACPTRPQGQARRRHRRRASPRWTARGPRSARREGGHPRLPRDMKDMPASNEVTRRSRKASPRSSRPARPR